MKNEAWHKLERTLAGTNEIPLTVRNYIVCKRLSTYLSIYKIFKGKRSNKIG